MSDPKFPPTWDAERLKRLVDHYDGITEDDLTAEDDLATQERDGSTFISVPKDLLPEIRQLIAARKAV